MSRPTFEEFQKTITRIMSDYFQGVCFPDIQLRTLYDSMAGPQEPIGGIPADHKNVIVRIKTSGGRILHVVGNYIRPRTEEADTNNDYIDLSQCPYDEEKDVWYLPEGWYEQSLYGNLDCCSWKIQDEVIGYYPLPAVRVQEEKRGK